MQYLTIEYATKFDNLKVLAVESGSQDLAKSMFRWRYDGILYLLGLLRSRLFIVKTPIATEPPKMSSKTSVNADVLSGSKLWLNSSKDAMAATTTSAKSHQPRRNLSLFENALLAARPKIK